MQDFLFIIMRGTSSRELVTGTFKWKYYTVRGGSLWAINVVLYSAY